jgi:hypothetical protein
MIIIFNQMIMNVIICAPCCIYYWEIRY